MENVSWNGETSTVLVYDSDLNELEIDEANTDGDEDQTWKVERKESVKNHIDEFIKLTEEEEVEDSEPKEFVIRLQDENEKSRLIDFIVDHLDTEHNQIKDEDLKFIAQIKVSEIKKIINLDK